MYNNIEPEIEAHIAHGNVADTKKYPWIVRLWIHDTDSLCTGAVLDRLHVLTAAHCVDKQFHNRLLPNPKENNGKGFYVLHGSRGFTYMRPLIKTAILSNVVATI